MNYIFLDIDGVLNCQEDIIAKAQLDISRIERHFNEEAYKRLSRICLENNAQIIISSTWRLGLKENRPDDRLTQRFNELCKKYNLKVVGYLDTPINNRGALILKYVKEHFTAADKYIVIDDEHIDYVSSQKIIKTDFKTGLLDFHICQAKQLFSCQ